MASRSPSRALLALSSALALGAVHPVTSSAQNISATPTFETLKLTAGFSPDPQVFRFSAGGSDEVTRGGCTMHIHSGAPDFDLNYRAGTLPLTISATAEADLMLLVNTPDGRWHCDDDSGEGVDPSITFSSPQSGNYNIWVGTYSESSGALPAAELYVSELGSTGNGSGGSGRSSAVELNWGASPTYGTIDLGSGFSPDPYSRSVSAGGSDRAPDLGAGCRGHVNASAPDLDLNYTSGSFPLHIYARSDTDVTLIVNQPDGSWICGDDANGSNPHVRIAEPMSGNYNIWIGTYGASSSPLPQSVLYISELSPDW